MNYSTIKEKILKTLLESPKTTGKIAIELGYIDKNGYGRYNIIKPDLNTLEQYGFIHRIESDKKTAGAPATTYDIVYEISFLRKILEKYPLLSSDLQKSERIISILSDSLMPNRIHDLFKHVVGRSPSLFEYCLKNESFLSKWVRVINDLHLLNHTVEEIANEKVKTSAIYEELFIMMFEHYIIEDHLKGVSTPEELNLLKSVKQNFKYPNPDLSFRTASPASLP